MLASSAPDVPEGTGGIFDGAEPLPMEQPAQATPNGERPGAANGQGGYQSGAVATPTTPTTPAAAGADGMGAAYPGDATAPPAAAADGMGTAVTHTDQPATATPETLTKVFDGHGAAISS